MSKRISSRKFVILFAAAVSWAALPSLYAAGQRRPSIVLVILDSVRADRLSPYGYSKSSTTALGKFADKAVVFENAYANAGWTGASIATIMTGRRPFSHGLIGRNDGLAEGVETMQSLLSGEGYATAAFFSGLSGVIKYGLNRGFGNVMVAEQTKPMDRQVDEALAWQNSLPADKDFFMVIHANDAHFPYLTAEKTPLQDEWRLPDGRNFFRYYNNSFFGWQMRGLDPEKWKKTLAYRGDPAFLAEVSRAYDSCVNRLDGAVALLLAGLEKSTERPLLIIVTADHGELLGRNGLIGHGYGLFEPVVKVPLLISFPGQTVGRRTLIKAEHADLLPTICQTAGVVCPENLDGRDLMGKAWEASTANQWGAAGGIGDAVNQVVRVAAFTEKNKKLLLLNTRWNMFDLAVDPNENKDISRAQPGEFLRLASNYLTFSRFGVAGGTLPTPKDKVRDCSIFTPSQPDIPAGTEPCERARMEAEYLAAVGDSTGAFKTLRESRCAPEVAAKYQEIMKMLSQSYNSVRPPERKGYIFSAAPDRWTMRKDDFSVIYSSGTGLKCSTVSGLPTQSPVCADLGEALLNCAERYRFADAGPAPTEKTLENALRKAGYLP